MLTVDSVIERLGYGESADLVRASSVLVPAARRHVWATAQSRLGIDAAFFEGRLPIIYFRGLSLPDEAEVEEAIVRLHRGAWSESRAQLLVVVLPTEVRVLDARVPPGGQLEPIAHGHLGSQSLTPFTRENFLRGTAANVLSPAPRRASVIERLRSDLRPARKTLAGLGLADDVADPLLARCLFVRFLEAHGMFASSGSDHASFTDLLYDGVASSYQLFTDLSNRFNGDTLRVTDAEHQTVTGEHLRVVADLLTGVGPSGQLTFIERYDFSTITAETLGAVYEEFLAPVHRETGAYYTPGRLVDACLDELWPTGDFPPETTVLDPACGSGLFLARAFSRLLDVGEQAHGRPLTPAEMVDVLAHQIYGCDLAEDALRIAALSCYLILLDRIGEGETNDSWAFPPLVGRNLRAGDFFDHLDYFSGPFDAIATNPPWSTLTESADAYLATTKRPTGSRLPLAQAFYWACAERLAPEGRMAILMPARSLYNQRPGDRAFQAAALIDTALDTILDLSAFRHQLFSNAVAPCALFVVRGSGLRPRDHITFSAPKPGPTSMATGRIAVDGDRITRLLREQLARNPALLRPLIFGDLRDVDLIGRLQRLGPTLRDFLAAHKNAGWAAGVGYQTVRGGSDMPMLRKVGHIFPEAIRQFRVTLSAPIDITSFHRTRDPAIYMGPRVVVARGIDTDRRMRAAFLSEPASFSESIFAIRAPDGGEDTLRAICAFLNSELCRYILLMTASSWGIERPELKAQDLQSLPMPFLANPDAVSDLSGLASAAGSDEADIGSCAQQIEHILRSSYKLADHDLAIIDDRLDIQLNGFADPLHSAAYAPPTATELRDYADMLTETLSVSLGTEPQVAVARNRDQVVAAIGLDGAPPETPVDLDLAVGVLGNASGTIIIRRVTRVYGERSVVMSKSAERRQVSKAAALHDADEITGELLRAAVRRRQTATAR